MIKSFADKNTELVFNRNFMKGFPISLNRSAYKKLLLIDAAERLSDLKIPPGNRLEKLSGELTAKYSIRINEQWRIVFQWKENSAHQVQIIDYHKG